MNKKKILKMMTVYINNKKLMIISNQPFLPIKRERKRNKNSKFRTKIPKKMKK